MDQLLQRYELVLRLRFAASHHREGAGHDFEVVRVTPVIAIGPSPRRRRHRVLQGLLGGEDHLGGAGGERLAGSDEPA